MRWVALAVDYEMAGKDLLDSVQLSNQMCRMLGGTRPHTLTYEMPLDERGAKISKSKGNGIAVEEWLTYAPPESLAFFMYQKPKAARRLYFDVIPRTVDDYLAELQQFPTQDTKQRLNTAVWHIHDGTPPKPEVGVSFGMLRNLVSVCHSDDPGVIWHYVTRYVPEAMPETSPRMNQLVGYAIRYYQDFVRPAKPYRPATQDEKQALEDLWQVLASMPANATADDIQTQVYAVGQRHTCFKDWFTALYQILLGQDSGPRTGSFMALYGIGETVAWLDRAIAGEELSGPGS
jgi:lysyl-tRNA synthetase, class I